MHITTTHLPASDVGSTTTHLLDQAASLVAYAKKDKEFAAFLYHQTGHLFDTTMWALCPTAPSPHLLPVDTESAMARTQWLISEIAKMPEEEVDPAVATLVDWRKQVAPQELIIGIVGVAIIGPTLGIVKRRKKKKSVLPIIIDESLAALPAPELASIVHEASTSLVSSQLRRMGGDAHRLHPDLFEWYFEHRGIALYQTNPGALAQLQQHLESEQLPHTLIHAEDNLQAIALSPNVNDDILDTVPLQEF